jgi:NADH:ubiquinone oxidoreductase subunit 3 (subunit A)
MAILSLYSMYALQITLLDTFSQGENDLRRYGLFGYIAAAIILVLSLIGFVYSLQKKKTIAKRKERALTKK